MVGAVLRASFFLLSGLMLGFAFLLVASQGSLGLAQTTSAITPTTGAGNLGTAVTQPAPPTTLPVAPDQAMDRTCFIALDSSEFLRITSPTS